MSSSQPASNSFLRELAEVVVLAVILYFGITFVVQVVRVEGVSMVGTLANNDYLIENKTDYRLHAPQRGDIIVLRAPTNQTVDFIKRVIGLPGERLLIRDGVVYINGRRLVETYLPEPWTSMNNWPLDGSSSGEVIPPDHYFVMGDNRNRSQDSRTFGPISRDEIEGRAWFRIWPLDSFGNIYEKAPVLQAASP